MIKYTFSNKIYSVVVINECFTQCVFRKLWNKSSKYATMVAHSTAEYYFPVSWIEVRQMGTGIVFLALNEHKNIKLWDRNLPNKNLPLHFDSCHSTSLRARTCEIWSQFKFFAVSSVHGHGVCLFVILSATLRQNSHFETNLAPKLFDTKIGLFTHEKYKMKVKKKHSAKILYINNTLKYQRN